jgi:hypothetical protein
MVGQNETTEMLPKLPIHSIVCSSERDTHIMAKWGSLRNLQPTWLVKIISLFLFLNKCYVAQENRIIYYDEWYHWQIFQSNDNF